MSDTKTVKIVSRYGGLSRGKCWGRQGTGDNVRWAEKDGSFLYLTLGTWHVGSTDGFSRKDRATVTVNVDGTVDGLPNGWHVR